MLGQPFDLITGCGRADHDGFLHCADVFRPGLHQQRSRPSFRGGSGDAAIIGQGTPMATVSGIDLGTRTQSRGPDDSASPGQHGETDCRLTWTLPDDSLLDARRESVMRFTLNAKWSLPDGSPPYTIKSNGATPPEISGNASRALARAEAALACPCPSIHKVLVY